MCHVMGLACPRVSRASVPRPCSSRPRSATVSEVGAIDIDLSIHRTIAMLISFSLVYLTPVSRVLITYIESKSILKFNSYLLETNCFGLRLEIKKKLKKSDYLEAQNLLN